MRRKRAMVCWRSGFELLSKAPIQASDAEVDTASTRPTQSLHAPEPKPRSP